MARRPRPTPLLALLLAVGLFGAACSDADDGAATVETTGPADTTGTGEPTTSIAGEEDAPATTVGEGACPTDELPVVEEGTLTVATGEPVFEPWMVDDDPTNGEGFESALVYALAGELGFAPEDVTWVRTGFDEAIAPGDKAYDFNVQQYSITAVRDEVVDFSTGYYQVEQALVAAPDSPVADATSVADLQGARLGAAIGTTSLDYIDQVIEPDAAAQVYDDNAAAKAAFDAGQVDGLVFDLPTAYFITAVEIPDASIVGVLPHGGEVEELGLLFADASPLVPCVDEALEALVADGTVESLEEQWLQQGGEIPTLSS